MALYEANYVRLLALVPHLHTIPATGASQVAPQVDGSPDLYLTVLERTRYTTIFRLTYYFRHGGDPVADPDARLRVYHDARLVEVLSCRDGRAPRPGARLGLMHRWQANLFLEKWLNYCLRQGHCFRPSAHAAAPVHVLSDA
ncbi:MAG TPA: DUF1249 domain-containing protein [Chromatiales bacterium]|nr:DUF1249 domain-containing protein [Chromatiales bacterium]